MTKKKTTNKTKPMFGKVIVRCRDAGVHYGTYISHNGREVKLTKSRRMWRWFAAQGISLSDVAVHGINQSKSKIASEVLSIILLDACEIIPVTPDAARTIEDTPCAQP